VSEKVNQHAENPSAPETPIATFISRLSEYAAAGLRYWEPRRAIFNLALAAVVGIDFAAGWPRSWTQLTFNTVLGLFFLAVLANVCYCAVYAVDLFVQFSGLHASWSRGRIAILIVGTAFAAVIAHFFALSIFSGN
jgi:hypothetical protein